MYPIHHMALYAACICDDRIDFAKHIGFDQARNNARRGNRQDQDVCVSEVIKRFVCLVYRAALLGFQTGGFRFVEPDDPASNTNLAQAQPHRAPDKTKPNDPYSPKIQPAHFRLSKQTKASLSSFRHLG
jgi:hypothetical protein